MSLSLSFILSLTLLIAGLDGLLFAIQARSAVGFKLWFVRRTQQQVSFPQTAHPTDGYGLALCGRDVITTFSRPLGQAVQRTPEEKREIYKQNSLYQPDGFSLSWRSNGMPAASRRRNI